MLILENIRKTYAGPDGAVRAVDGCSLAVKAGEFVAVRGPSGCGKSTLLLTAGGLLRPDHGRVLVGEQDPYAMTAEARASFRATRIGFVFQQFHLIPYLGVLDNVLAPSLAAPSVNAPARAKSLLDQFGLGPRLQHVPAELSTGEKQRAALARALLNSPKLLLADEPTGNLDEENGGKVLGILADYARAGGAVLLVTHDPKVAGVAHRILQMKDGRLEV
jgi:putative ABC transport system ATP-binding protein